LRTRARPRQPHAGIGFLQHQVVRGAIRRHDVKIHDADGLARAQLDEKIIALALKVRDICATQLQPDDAGTVQINGVQRNGTGFGSYFVENFRCHDIPPSHEYK